MKKIQRPQYCPIGTLPIRMLESSFIRTCLSYKDKSALCKSEYAKKTNPCIHCAIGKALSNNKDLSPKQLIIKDNINWIDTKEAKHILYTMASHKNAQYKDQILSDTQTRMTMKEKDKIMNTIKSNIREAAVLAPKQRKELLLFAIEQLAFSTVSDTSEPSVKVNTNIKEKVQKKLTPISSTRTKRISDDVVKDIKKAMYTNMYTRKELSTKFSVSLSTLKRIANNEGRYADIK